MLNPLRVRRTTAGFTLLEILVVMFIIGMIATFSVLSIDDRANDDRLQNEAERLKLLLDIAAEDAILYGVEVGLDLSKHSYRFLRLGNDGWQAISRTDHPLRKRDLGENMELRLAQTEEDRPTLAQSRSDKNETEESVRPEVLFLSSGEITPFKLQLRADGVRTVYTLEGDLTGKLKMQPEQDDSL